MPLPLAFPLAAAVSLLTGLAAASQASDWGDVVAVSSTMGVHDGRICVGEATRGDIGCPTYAPQVGTDGSISASAFIGDGSGLTGVVASTADRIVSGTTSLLAVSSTGFVSLTQAGTNTGWFDPARGLVTLGVSATGAISGTRGYFSDLVGIGKVATVPLDVRAAANSNSVDVVTATALSNYSYGTSNNSSLNVLFRRHTAGTGWDGTNIRLQRQVDATPMGFIDFGLDGAPSSYGLGLGFGNSTSLIVADSFVRISGTASVFNPISSSVTPFSVRSGSSNVNIGHTLEGFATGTNNSGAIYFGPTPYGSASGVTTTTAGIEASWGGASSPQMHMGVLRDRASAVYSAYYGGALAMSTSGTERMRIDSNGNVGIGVSPTAPYMLDVSGSIRGRQGLYIGQAAAGLEITTTTVFSPPLSGLSQSGISVRAPTSSHLSFDLLNNDVGDSIAFRHSSLNNGVPNTVGLIYKGNGNVGIGLITPTTNLEVSGTISATRYVGDGSGLTGVVASTADRIVSGSTSLLAVSGTGFVSLTQAGTNTGWFDPARGLVTLGVSSTGRISTTDLTVRGAIDIVTGTYSTMIGQYAGEFSAPDRITALGYQAAQYDQSARVTAVGYQASRYNSGTNITSIGHAAGQYNSSLYLTALGAQAGQYNSASYVTAVGALSGEYNSGVYLTALGYYAGRSNSGTYVTTLGFQAGQSNQGDGLTATGSRAGMQNSGSAVTAIGNAAAQYNVGSYVIAVGQSAAQNNSSSQGVFIGHSAGINNLGNNVTAVGYVAGNANTGAQSTLSGAYAGQNNSGAYTTALGYMAASSNTFSNVTALGNNAQPNKANQVVLGDVNIVEVSTAGVILSAGVSTTGIVTATRFVGDGSGLTNLQGASADRIVSGTTSLVAVSSTGFVSLTQAGTNTGWFDPARGLVTLGVSATGAVSATRGYFSGNVAIGSSTLPGINHRELFLYTDGPATSALTGNADLRVQSKNRNAFLTLIGGGMGVYFHPAYSYGTASQNPGFLLYTGTTNPYMQLGVSNTEIMRLTSSSNVGIGTTAPTTRLEVNGTVSATYVKLADNDDKPCAPDNNGTIRFFNGRISLCRAH